MRRSQRSLLACSGLLVGLLSGGCRDLSSTEPDARSGVDAARSIDAAPASGDGAPMRRSCTSNFGSGLSAAFGRLDGYLVSVVEPGTPGCNSDNDHLHLQVLVGASTYDIAINLGVGVSGDVATAARPLPLTTPWQEGWHPTLTFDYVTDVNLHSDDFAPHTPAEVLTELKAALASVNHISVYATGYGPDGAHLIHRVAAAGPNDGGVVTQPLSATPQVRMFRFLNQVF